MLGIFTWYNKSELGWVFTFEAFISKLVEANYFDIELMFDKVGWYAYLIYFGDNLFGLYL